jgi:hypothetical protein
VARAVVVAAALAGCAEAAVSVDGRRDAGASARPAHERVDCDVATVLEYCGGGTCHYDSAARDVASDLVLWEREAARIPDDVPASLVGARATYHNVPDPERCPSPAELRVDPSNVGASLLLSKLDGTHTCGVEMPKFPYPEWGTAENPGPQRAGMIQCIRDWVALLVEDYAQAP